MKDETVDLALVALDVYHTELSPQYEGLRAQLVGSLATGQTTLEGLRQQELERRANYDLILNFTANLPSATDGSIMVEDPHLARQAHANALWLFEPNSWNSTNGSYIPYYIIGRRATPPGDYRTKGSPATDLLLSSAYPNAVRDALRIVTVRDAELVIALQTVQAASFRDFTPEEITRMFDRASGMLRVSHYGGIRTELAHSGLLSEAPRPKRIARKVADKGLAVRTVDSYNQRIIDDTALASFDVFTSLNRLATAFDKKDELAALLEAYKQQVSLPTSEAEDS